MLKIYKLSYYIFPLMLGFLSMDTIAAINVYGPGGPVPAMHEAAKQFKNKTGIDVHVTRALLHNEPTKPNSMPTSSIVVQKP